MATIFSTELMKDLRLFEVEERCIQFVVSLLNKFNVHNTKVLAVNQSFQSTALARLVHPNEKIIFKIKMLGYEDRVPNERHYFEFKVCHENGTVNLLQWGER